MDELDGSFLTLKISTWRLRFSHEDNGGRLNLSIGAEAHSVKGSFLSLTSGEELSDIPISFTFLDGAVLRGDNRPLERGIGVFSYVGSGPRQSAIGCWLPSLTHHKDLWTHISNGSFTRSSIHLELAPVLEGKWDVLTHRHLFVLSYELQFDLEQLS
jgi:hypothetical protein